MDNIIQFVLEYNNNNVGDYCNELSKKIYLEPNYDLNDVLFAIIDLLIKTHDSVDILTYDYIIPLLEYIIKNVRVNGVIMTRDKTKLSDMYTSIEPTLYPDSEFTKHVIKYIKSVSISNNMMLLFNTNTPTSSHTKVIPITIDELLKRVEKLENEVRELKSKL